MPFNRTINGIRVHGLVFPPGQAQLRDDRILLYVNGEAANDRVTLYTIRETYKGRLLSKKCPRVALFIDLPPEEVGVNVHPTKIEVRLRDRRFMFGAVLRAVEETIVRNLPTDDLDAAPSGEEACHAPAYEPKPLGFWDKADRERIMRPRQQLLVPSDRGEMLSAVFLASERPASELDSVPEPLLYGEEGLPRDGASDNHAVPSSREAPRAFTVPQPPTAGAIPLPEIVPYVTMQPPATNRTRPSESEQFEIEQLGEGQVHVGPYVYMGQVDGTHLLLRGTRSGRDNTSLLILDQHAAHERVLVFRVEAGGFSGMSQPLVLLLERTLHPTKQGRIQEFRESLSVFGLGLVPREQGAGTVLEVRAVSPLLERTTTGEFVREVLAGRKEGPHSPWATVTYKTTIKVGDALAPDEAVNLIAQWLMTKNRQLYPHRRSCVLQWGTNDLDKTFKRMG